ncbi:MAG: 4Fe-4S dicluster domain-containing protein [Bacteroidales bacterium]|jgi:ferredoxin|nr:4Fe-4S dicluster domain-containing protein [Bacteroidales bacterium]
MKNFYSVFTSEWNHAIEMLLQTYAIYAPMRTEETTDYELLDNKNLSEAIYNIPKPTTPLKTFFLPVKENVTTNPKTEKKRVITGIPNCDLQALNLLDEIYLNNDFKDSSYADKRENTILIGSSCFSTQEHCHCVSYGINPYPESVCDISLAAVDQKIHLKVFTNKGEGFIQSLKQYATLSNSPQIEIDDIQLKQKKIENELIDKNKGLPDYKKTGEIVEQANDEIWEKYSSTCVSCGACATICPTCSCFLLVDKPGFEKVRQLDACQYPGFERVAGDEDPLHGLAKRFKNRYFCKYFWKPYKFDSIACTGCGRCIEACIGNINKNELFRELAQ